MNQALTIAGAELRLMLRSRLALVGIATLLLLSAIAAVTSATQMSAAAIPVTNCPKRRCDGLRARRKALGSRYATR